MKDGDPPRLLDDPSVPSDLRGALSQAAQHTPPLDTAAGLAKLEAAMSAPAAAGGGGTVALAVAAAVVIGGAAWIATRPGDDVARPEPASVERVEVERVEVERVEVEVAAEPFVPAPADAAEDDETIAAQPSTVEPSTVEPSTVEPAPAPRTARPRPEREQPDDDSLARDMAQLAEARRALAADPARALALVDAGRRDFPRSIFREERDALRVLALAGLDRDAEARRLGTAFLAAHPSSPFAERVRRAIEPPH